jgi:hypothetical protein
MRFTPRTSPPAVSVIPWAQIKVPSCDCELLQSIHRLRRTRHSLMKSFVKSRKASSTVLKMRRTLQMFIPVCDFIDRCKLTFVSPVKIRSITNIVFCSQRKEVLMLAA